MRADDYEDDEWDSDDPPADDGDNDDFDPEILCPYCKLPIHEETVRCPHCERYISREDSPAPSKPWWLLLVTAICLYLIYRVWIVGR